MNALRFGLEMVKDKVNIVDYLAITAIQVFIPELYYSIRDDRDVLLVDEQTVGPIDAQTQKEEAKKRCDDMIAKASKLKPDVVKEILTRLFPRVESFYSNTYYGPNWLSTWRREGRICSPDMFDTYFKLALPEGDISLKEMETILSLASSSETFGEAILGLIKDDRIVRFLERLEDYTREYIPQSVAGSILCVLMDIGDLVPEKDVGFLEMDSHMRVLRVIHQLCLRFSSQQERYNILKQSIQNAQRSLYTIVDEINIEELRHDKYEQEKNKEPDDKLTVNGEQLKDLQRLVCGKIEEWASDGRLGKASGLQNILFIWRQWGSVEKVKSFVDDMIKNESGLIDFIASFTSNVKRTGAGSHVVRIQQTISLKSVAEFVPVSEIEPRIRLMRSSEKFDSLSDKERKAIQVFLDTYDGKIKNKFDE